MYCRHCFRRRLAGREECNITREECNAILNYISEHREIAEVILSGGDPFGLPDDNLSTWITSLMSIPHVRIVRLHTRYLVTNPFRVTPKLIAILKQEKPVYVVTHFNHAQEVTSESKKAIQMLVDAGITVLNQSVLLKGINDSEEAMRNLLWALITARVKPYYLHYLDKAQGTSHFRTSISAGIRLLKRLRGTIPGYAIPHFVIDIPEGYGKIPIEYGYIRKKRTNELILETPCGLTRTYALQEDISEEEHLLVPSVP